MIEIIFAGESLKINNKRNMINHNKNDVDPSLQHWTIKKFKFKAQHHNITTSQHHNINI